MQNRNRKIDRSSDLNVQDITAENLRVFYNNACHNLQGRVANRVVTYRIGYMTPLGNIEKSCWKELALQAIKNARAEELRAGVEDQFRAQNKQRGLAEEDFEIEVLIETVQRMADAVKNPD